MALSVDRSVRSEISTAYARLEEKILERDQKGASDIFYDLVRAQVFSTTRWTGRVVNNII